jgi:hypothetical protein
MLWLLFSLVFWEEFVPPGDDQTDNDQDGPHQDFNPPKDDFILGEVPSDRGLPDSIINPFPGPTPPPFPRLSPLPVSPLPRHIPLYRRLLAAKEEVGLIVPIVFTTVLAVGIYKLGPLFIELVEEKTPTVDGQGLETNRS